MDRQDDLYLVEKVVNGDMSAFSALVKKYRSQAYTLAFQILRNESEAEEAAQDAFLKAFKAMAKFKRESSFSTWFYRIIYNTSLSRLKKKRLNTTVIDDSHVEMSIEETENAYYGLVHEDRKKYLQIAIRQLSEDDAALVNLYYKNEKGMDEIAVIMGLSHGNVRVKLTRIRKRLHVYLSKVLKKELGGIL